MTGINITSRCINIYAYKSDMLFVSTNVKLYTKAFDFLLNAGAVPEPIKFMSELCLHCNFVYY